MSRADPGRIAAVEAILDETPRVDPHTHIHCDRPAAPDLAALLGYHWVQSELVAVGMPKADLDPSRPAEERLRLMRPYLNRIRNTAVGWCLARILQDLYEFPGPIATPEHLDDLTARVGATAADADWPRRVLVDRCGIEAFVTSLGNRGDASSRIADRAWFMLDAHYLFCPGVATDLEPFFSGRARIEEYLEALDAILGHECSNGSNLARAVKDWLNHVVVDRVTFSNTFLPIEQRFREPEPSAVDAALARARRGGRASIEDLATIAAAVAWAILEWHHDRSKTLQIAVGAEYFICDGKSIPSYQTTWASDMARVFHRFGRARFELMVASDPLNQEAAVLARQFPNVYLAGYWWHAFVPERVEANFALRTQVAPMTKAVAFLSDAYSVEWAYAKWRLVRKSIAAASARLVEIGFLDEALLPEFLRTVLHDTPRSLHQLHQE